MHSPQPHHERRPPPLTITPTNPRTMTLPFWYRAPADTLAESEFQPGPTTNSERKELGAGRSATVYQVGAGENSEALKVFRTKDALASFAQFLVSGAPNPYRWNEDAIRCAHLRREILATLVPIWFKDDPQVRCAVAHSHGYEYSKPDRAYVLRTEFVTGRLPLLSHPQSQATDVEALQLKYTMLKLQRELMSSGFFGAVWQAGYGNPVAANNFLMSHDTSDSRPLFTWIDLESGVPALAPISRKFLSFYVPQAIAAGGPLFDDVNVERLKNYLKTKEVRALLAQELGSEGAYCKLLGQTTELGLHQAKWKRLSRSDAALMAEEREGGITRQEAQWYRANLSVWYARSAVKALEHAIELVSPTALLGYATRVAQGAGLWMQGVALTFIPAYRERVLKSTLEGRIGEWQAAQGLPGPQAEQLRNECANLKARSYLYDFAGHASIYVTTYPVKLAAIVLGVSGTLEPVTAAVIYTFAAAATRTVYSLARWISDPRRSGHLLAALISPLPKVGNLAYLAPAIGEQRNRSPLALFALYDAMAIIGKRLPIIGGEGSMTQYALNRWVNRLRPDVESAAGPTGAVSAPPANL